jgi:glucose-6-phosphate 1-dehydrogenase
VNSTGPTSGILVIFGITGDLARRYLLPALYDLSAQGLLPEHFEIIGATRRGAEVTALLEGVKAEIERRGATADPSTIKHLGSLMRVVKMDPTVQADFSKLKTTLDLIEDERGVCLNRLFYLSIPPTTYGPVVDLLASSGLNSGCQHGVADSRIMVEKPFGYDLTSAEELVGRLRTGFRESQIFRIDHYLAKETAQNILTFRFANPIFEPAWDRHHITNVVITASETIGIEGRASYYEYVGMLRDFIQNHLLQLLAITTMEKPAVLDSKHIHAEKLKLLGAIPAIQPDDVDKSAIRGQYRGYRDEVGNPDSISETFAGLKLSIDTERWRGVPVILQAGKRLDRRSTEIAVTFGSGPGHTPNTLCFRIQPNEGIAIDLQAKKPGLNQQTERVEMAFNYKNSGPNAYERVLIDGIRGDQTLFATSDEVLASWRIVESVVNDWAKGPSGLIIYEPGSTADQVASKG